ncbi:hypothetical protein BDD12DRAFT_853445 [Trichophaea hybrida]|nr:hypothetical protein BDD12DRAFT_853445 [Trichophaea hybrida]
MGALLMCSKAITVPTNTLSHRWNAAFKAVAAVREMRAIASPTQKAHFTTTRILFYPPWTPEELQILEVNKDLVQTRNLEKLLNLLTRHTKKDIKRKILKLEKGFVPWVDNNTWTEQEMAQLREWVDSGLSIKKFTRDEIESKMPDRSKRSVTRKIVILRKQKEHQTEGETKQSSAPKDESLETVFIEEPSTAKLGSLKQTVETEVIESMAQTEGQIQQSEALEGGSLETKLIYEPSIAELESSTQTVETEVIEPAAQIEEETKQSEAPEDGISETGFAGDPPAANSEPSEKAVETEAIESEEKTKQSEALEGESSNIELTEEPQVANTENLEDAIESELREATQRKIAIEKDQK